MNSSRIVALLLALLPGASTGCAEAPTTRFEVLEVAGETLRGNPLNDPAARRVAVFLPRQARPGVALPIVYFLPGYGGSSAEFIAQGERSPFATLVQQFTDDGLPLVIAVPDGRTRWGGSQYLNSAAQGNYADYIAEEIVAAVEAKHPAAQGRAGRIVAGHSSGGYGALMLAMSRQKLFGAVVALSPDSDFAVTHRGVIDAPQVQRVTPAQAAAFSAPKVGPRPTDEIVELMLGLSAAYAPVGPEAPGRLRWIYDEAGKLEPKAWQQWLDHDPLLIVRKNANAFAPDQRIYLDGSARDEWGFNVSARKVYDVLRERPAPATFHEPPGGHSDRIPERLARGLQWVLRPPSP